MKIAIPTDNGGISAHFGRCPEYTIITISNNNVEKQEILKNSGHRTGFIPKFLHENGIDVIIAGGIGSKAINYFQQYNIKVYKGLNAPINELVELYLSGNIKNEDFECVKGSGRDYGIPKADAHSN